MFCISCAGKSIKMDANSLMNDSLTSDALHKISFIKKIAFHDPSAAEIDSIEKISAPVLGYRFIIKGDFDGDGIKETLTEHFYSKKLNRETYKFYDSLDYMGLVDFTIQKEPWSFLTCSNKKTDTLKISDA